MFFAPGSDSAYASLLTLSTVRAGKRDVIHDDLFFVCFGEVCQTAIHTHLQLQRRRRASDATHDSGRGDAPQRTRSCSAPLISEVMSLQGAESSLLRPAHAVTQTEETQGERENAQTQMAGSNADETAEARAPAIHSAAGAWVPPHRRARKVGFADSARPDGIH